jgi:hypothetical protein
MGEGVRLGLWVRDGCVEEECCRVLNVYGFMLGVGGGALHVLAPTSTSSNIDFELLPLSAQQASWVCDQHLANTHYAAASNQPRSVLASDRVMPACGGKVLSIVGMHR